MFQGKGAQRWSTYLIARKKIGDDQKRFPNKIS